MMVFAGYIATSALALLMIWGVLLWGINRTAGVRNTLGLCFGLGASYWVGRALDVAARAYYGELSWATLIAPVGGWLLACAAIIASFVLVTNPYVLATPFALNGLIALVAAFVNPRHVLVGLPLLVLAGLSVWTHKRCAAVCFKQHETSPPIEDISSDKIQTEIQSLARLTRLVFWAQPVTMLGASVTSFWLTYRVFALDGFGAALVSFFGLSIVFGLFGISPMFAIAASVLSFHFKAVGIWLPIVSYVLGVILLYRDLRTDNLRRRVDPYNLGSIDGG